MTATLTQHRDRLETLARALLKNETLDEVDAYAAAQMPPRVVDAGASVSHLVAGEETLTGSRPEPADTHSQ